MYPVRRSVCNLAGSAALLEDEAAHKLLVDSRTPPGRRRARINRHKLCGGVCEACGVPRDITWHNERFVMILFHVHLQQATVKSRTLLY